ncbi:cytochrome c [Defluviimonas sp. WL0002]|uniref:Cytochrome c n=1 Tax=Albidovulum marisflavi TaxID=2984159 RepID=A0ABT2ZEG5_9RHOB|nr:cytochrome c [Defluviimonas sp. WL0002]MCV2869501.1 cytochrome c [Defluviimonas sp. WL0002]
MKLTVALPVVTLAILGACAPEQQVSGRSLYLDYCASCHGVGGKGDGPAAEGLGKMPADLTRIAARNGGVFPKVRVMSTIDGYTRRGDRSSVMPELGVVLQEGPLVLVDTGDGVMTPTPVNLVALADYLEKLQN